MLCFWLKDFFHKGKSIDVLLSDKKEGFSRQKFLESSELKIHGVIPTDFNGDSQMDVLVTYENSDGKTFSAGIHFGKPGESVVGKCHLWRNNLRNCAIPSFFLFKRKKQNGWNSIQIERN